MEVESIRNADDTEIGEKTQRGNETVAAIVPARGGSRGIPRKNIANVLCKPLIAYTIEVAGVTECIDRIIVSTDDEEIREISLKYGAEVPFLRPKELAQDNTPDKPVLIHAIKWLEENEGYIPKIVLNLRPTSPLRLSEDIEKVVKKMISTGCDSVRTVCQVKHHPYWMKRLEGDRLMPFLEGKDERNYYQRQLLPPTYRINGCVDAIRRSVILKQDFLYGDDMRAVVMPAERSHEVDAPMDLKIVEMLLKERLRREQD